MSPSNRPGGREKRIVSGGGNARRRGSGLSGGPVGGGYSRPSAGSGESGNRSGGGGGLLAILAALLIGASASGDKGKKSGCLKRICILLVILAVGYFLIRACSGSGLLGGYEDDSGSDTGLSGSVLTEQPTAPDESVDTLDALLNGLNGATAPLSTATENAYQAHEPDETVAVASRERYTTLRGDGNDKATIMVYMCGADLESRSGMATSDLNEMLNAKISDNVQILVETGGASNWQNNVVSNKTNQIYQIKQGGILPLEKNLGKKPMTDPKTLTAFIQYCKTNYPADRYMLILWDHGGGSIAGYGYDELFPDGTMTIDEINGALKSGGCKFDFIGFDACLMATLETALVLEPYADYLIASEATEPGTGWYYTKWLSELSDNTSMPTTNIGRNIIDDFVQVSQQASSSSSATLSLIDLAELSGTVPTVFRTFAEETSALISADGYQQVSDARSGARDFSSSSKINQIDLVHFAENLDTDSSNLLADALRGCIKYNRVSKNISHANGVSIYFPYNSLSKVSTAINTYEKIGLDESYTKCIKSFASMAAGGSVLSGGSNSPLGSLLGDESGSLIGSLLGAAMEATPDSFSGQGSGSGTMDTVAELLDLFLSSSNKSIVTGDRQNDWLDRPLLIEKASYLASQTGNFNNLMLTQKDGRNVLSLTEEQWNLVKTLERNVFVDDGKGYIDLGLDTEMAWTDDGDLIMDYDGTWLSLNGQIVSYYFISESLVDDGYTILGRVPAMLTHTQKNATIDDMTDMDAENDDLHAKKDGDSREIKERVNIILAFTDENPYGLVLGAQRDYQDKTDVVVKGLLPIEVGDKLDFLCDYYEYDGSFLDNYDLGEQMTVMNTDWVIGNAPLGNERYRMNYRLTDIYGAKYWTPVIDVK
ncbi:MAG: clostripain-related cysteine peptidase [Clostridia bacterium]